MGLTAQGETQCLKNKTLMYIQTLFKKQLCTRDGTYNSKGEAHEVKVWKDFEENTNLISIKTKVYVQKNGAYNSRERPKRFRLEKILKKTLIWLVLKQKFMYKKVGLTTQGRGPMYFEKGLKQIYTRDVTYNSKGEAQKI